MADIIAGHAAMWQTGIHLCSWQKSHFLFYLLSLPPIFSCTFSLLGHKGLLEPIPNRHEVKAGLHRRQVCSSSQGHTWKTNNHSHSSTYKRFRILSFPHVHVFGLWWEAGEPGDNPRRHRVNIQTLQKGPKPWDPTPPYLPAVKQRCALHYCVLFYWFYCNSISFTY